ncbi:MAG: DNA mismatch repair endonuclease MutL [Bacteroidales bacterium]|nr:DNA mismatch repair endonuclease MutL [Bacteroidales bacterium]
MDIRILPANIANLIAAGEVVQRPSSAVKELMENALDAGAAKVTVVIKDAGRTLIQVIDDGCGMSPDEAVLCFERHATSKIASAEDLESISTFGFRGEALASIAAVAEVTLRTRREEDSVGCQVEFAGSRHMSTVEASCPVGSNFAVRNLFYNVPARRKFLKSDAVELKHIVEEFTRVALTRPDVAFTLIHNDRDIYVLHPAKSLKFRIQDLLGKNESDRMVDVQAETTVLRVEGFTCRPDLARKTAGSQFFFVNGRYFRSPYLHKAVMRAYEGLIPEGAVPSYFIYLQTDPHSIDVNIHPTKTEIKFEDEAIVFQVLMACVKEALGRNSFGAGMDFDATDAPQMPVISRNFDSYRPADYNPSQSLETDYNPFETPATVDSYKAPDSFKNPGSYVDSREDYGKLFENQTVPLSQVFVLDGRFAVSAAKDGLMIVSIRRALERILYERFLKAVSSGGHVSQAALLPVKVTVGAQNRLLLDEHSALLETLGFDITPFGNDTVVVNGVPDGFSCDETKVEALVHEILDILSTDHTSLPGVLESGLAEKFARAGAASGKNMTSPIQAQRLIDTLLSCDSPEFTPRGHRIITVLPLDEIDRLLQ